jgi:rubredoxin
METVVLKTFDNYFSANIILTRLQDAGIHCYLKDEYTVTIDPILSNAIGGIKLAVDIRDESAARILLQQFHNDYVRSAVCPKCNLHRIEYVASQKPMNIVSTILTWFFSSYAVSPEMIYKCSNCGYESKILPEEMEAPEMNE